MRQTARLTALIPASALTSVMVFAFGWQVQAQNLTPGAAAIGGTTGTGELIAPGGGSTSTGNNSTNTGSTSTPQATPRRNPRIHYPSNSWPMPLPPIRAQVEGQPISAFDPAGSEIDTPQTADAGDQSDTQNTDTTGSTGGQALAGDTFTTLTPVFDPDAENTPQTSPEPEAAQPVADPEAQPEPEVAPEPEPSQATAETDTTAVTSGATDENAPSAETQSNLAPPSSGTDFRMTALNFGSDSISLSDEHIGQLQAVVNLMLADPNVPLKVVAILAQAQANSEDAKLVARRRILAVRRYLLDQGLGAENLTFVISSNAQSEQFADHVLIQR